VSKRARSSGVASVVKMTKHTTSQSHASLRGLLGFTMPAGRRERQQRHRRVSGRAERACRGRARCCVCCVKQTRRASAAGAHPAACALPAP
jgi:hypothetical protein